MSDKQGGHPPVRRDHYNSATGKTSAKHKVDLVDRNQSDTDWQDEKYKTQ